MAGWQAQEQQGAGGVDEGTGPGKAVRVLWWWEIRGGCQLAGRQAAQG